jgi:pyruvate dehydrogenase E2 component (dihydrolipoamide acetyltransferase)
MTEGVRLHADVNIGIAVALEDGLLVPVIKGCQGLSLKEIAAASRDLISRAKAGNITEADIAGGTFSISNLGMYNVDDFTAVIHPPQGAILAVGTVADRPVIKGGHLAAARIMRLTLSADHRLIDGAYAARFLREVKRVLENPVTMLV